LADTIIKALGDLTQALNGRRNMKGIEQIEALTKIDELLNNIPTTNKSPTRKVPSMKQSNHHKKCRQLQG
jgi:hypothetical protein